MKNKIILKQTEAFMQWFIDKHFGYGSIFFDWWDTIGVKSWEKYLKEYLKEKPC